MCRNSTSNFTRRVSLFLLATLLFASVASAEEQPADLETASRYFRIAENAQDKWSEREAYYAKAEKIAERALEVSPDAADAHFLLFAVRGRRLLEDGISLLETRQFPKLKTHLTKTLELDPNHAHALAAKGGLLLDLPPLLGGNPKSALDHLLRAVALNPSGLHTRLSLSRALMKLGHTEKARQELQLTGHYACMQRSGEVLGRVDELLRDLGATKSTEADQARSTSPLREVFGPRAAFAATPASH